MTFFETLWRTFPSKEAIQTTCTNKQKDSNKPFGDYFAISLSDCLMKSGIDISSYKAKRC